MDYCDFGIEIEMPIWLLALLIIALLTIAIFTFIIELKIVKLRREEARRNKPKEDELQRLLNIINDRIIDLSNDSKGTMETEIKKYCFHHFKGMILGLMEERKKKDEKNDKRDL